jgi:hypothetical protein
MHIIITTIYSLQEPNLNHRNYSEQELNVDNFVQANEYDVHMYTKFQDVCKYRYFYTNLTLFCLFSIYIIYYYEHNTNLTGLWKDKKILRFLWTLGILLGVTYQNLDQAHSGINKTNPIIAELRIAIAAKICIN